MKSGLQQPPCAARDTVATGTARADTLHMAHKTTSDTAHAGTADTVRTAFSDTAHAASVGARGIFGTARTGTSRTARAVFCRVLCLLCAALLMLSGVSCRKKSGGSEVPLSPGLSLIEGSAIHEQGVALRTEHYTVTDGMLAYWCYDYGLSVMREMEKNKAFDSAKNLHDQMYSETESWYDTIMNTVLDAVCRTLIYCEGATAAGEAELPAETEAAIEQQLYTLRFRAAAENGEDLTAYLRRSYGSLMDEEDLATVLRYEAIASRYSSLLSDRLETEISAADALSYAAAHNLSDETPSRNLEYLIVSGSDEAAVKKNAAAALAAVQKAPVSGTLAGLETLGTAHTERNMIPENAGVAAISDWLYATGRKPGDAGTVTSDGVIFVLLYTGNGVSRGEVRGRMALFDAAYAEWYNALVAGLHFGYNYDVIDSYDVS